MLIEKKILKEIDFLIYKNKHLLIYIIIGILSIFLELFIRKNLINYSVNYILSTYISFVAAIFFAFFFNIKFNFNVPRKYFLRSLIYFFLISFSSWIFQNNFKNFIQFEKLNYEQTRILVSGIFFLVFYFLHLKLTFKDTRKVGVAIYANGIEDVKKIYEKIGQYPDFIHVDIIDQSILTDVSFNLLAAMRLGYVVTL